MKGEVLFVLQFIGRSADCPRAWGRRRQWRPAHFCIEKWSEPWGTLHLRDICGSWLFSLFYDGFEGLGVVHGEVSEYLAVDFDACRVETTHELGVREAFEACGSVDTLDPEGAEVALLVATVAEGVGQTFFPGVFGNGPNVLAGTIVTAGEFENSLTLCS